ncbi:anaphase-promoting complex subunit 10 [Cryptococcus deuterogattii 99/473]|uniref:Anaphase-promoting complex subunit 10 n=1 Tax=Cryptococcus deuterogattii Ram5 TaxID=1296110 RepID=A0A0D0V666_9TREE|nr:anaphase-promoting complex subunit 10 [Cryptococcus deuterogattii LA55]KIR35144.1 anaphase-promoting complex subunit 10 [Cryptococcus deuterogattii MMRL2647]KIR40445.1 anaphase-promoting complex subunit 10 [Cryptococcus deuterogattii Ram5]KIR93718.1 anaphase-promoting complex subunit 10 [Cryptococcus deuterogattii CBS 10090]KIY58686.1 anaphase-promoting complex subunit 10 [Cryptococcus deuterogattii 99/473]
MSSPAPNTPSPPSHTAGLPSLPSVLERPELSRLAQWSVSSHKYGFGVDNLRDGNDGTFWQCGTGVHDLQEASDHLAYKFSKPDGWHLIPLRPMEHTTSSPEIEGPPIPCHFLRILIFANHLNGKDTHVRGLKVFGPPGYGLFVRPKENKQLTASPLLKMSQQAAQEVGGGRKLLELGHDGLSGFTSTEFKMHEWIR